MNCWNRWMEKVLFFEGYDYKALRVNPHLPKD